MEEFTSCLLDPLKSNMEARHVFGDSLDDLMNDGIDWEQKKVNVFAVKTNGRKLDVKRRNCLVY